MRWSHIKHPNEKKKSQWEKKLTRRQIGDVQINKMRNIGVKWGMWHTKTTSAYGCFLLVWTIARWLTDHYSCFSFYGVFNSTLPYIIFSARLALILDTYVRYRSVFIFQFFRERFTSLFPPILSTHKKSSCLSWIARLCAKIKTNDSTSFLFACL